jgi:S-DNA-T family DNA segregation ATPase FtsK/SpoIIIE
VRIVTETRRASISGVQRRLKIGYNRAARLIEKSLLAGGTRSGIGMDGSRWRAAPDFLSIR